MGLAEDLVDAVVKLHSFRRRPEAAAAWPSVMAALSRVRDRARVPRPGRRGSPALRQAAAWMRRTLADAPIAEQARLEAAAILDEIEAMAGATSA